MTKSNLLKLFSIVLLLSFGCKENVVDTGSKISENITITLSRPRIINNTYTMDINSSEAIYDSIGINTTCKFIGNNNSMPSKVEISFGNFRPGFYYWHGSASVFISLGPAPQLPPASLFYSTDSGVTVISKYGSVGELVEGEFNGEFVHTETGGPDTIKITGRFSAKRVK